VIAALSLHRPALYNPALWSRDEVKNYFVARTALLERVVDDLRRERQGTRPQHRLVLGLRGMGKSTLLCRIAVAVEDDAELDAQWLPLTFPEEQYNVASLADFWLNCFDALGDLMERRGDDKAVATLDAEVEALDRKNSEDVLKALLQAAKRMKRRLLLLVDNIDLILERLKKEDWALRESLQAHPEIMLIGASARAMEATYDYGAAFYDFFKIDELRGLTEAEMRDTILNLARLRGADAMIQKVLDEPGRLRVLHTLTGGNPRTAVLLYGVLLKGMDGDVRADLEGLLDEVTPLYKARFEELPPLSQQLMDKLALHWDPMTARQLADMLGWEVNLVSAQLTRLMEVGVVEKVKPGQGKRAAFQVGERFFNIWYLMRASRRVRRKLVWFVDFLRVFYSTEELRRAARSRLSADGGDVKDVEYALALSRALGPEPIAKALETYALESLFSGELRTKLEEILDLSGEDKDLVPKAERIRVLKEMKAKLPGILRKAKVRFSIPKFVEAVLSFPLDVRARKGLLIGIASWSAKEIAVFRAAVLRRAEDGKRQLGCDVFRSLSQAIACGEMENDEDYEGAAAAAERFSCPMLSLLPRLKDAVRGLLSPTEAESVARQALALEPAGPYYWRVLGDVLGGRTERFVEAEEAYRKAIELDSQYALTWANLGSLLQGLPGREAEAEQALRRAVELEPDNYHPWKRLGRFLVQSGSNAEDTERVVRRTCELGADDPDSWLNLAIYWMQREQNYSEAYEAVQKAVMLGPTLGDVRYVAALAALALKRRDEAIAHLDILFQNTGNGDLWGADAALVGLAVDAGFGGDVLRLMDESGAGERWRPLHEALAAAVAGDPDLLNGVAPEVRAPALEILAEIAPALMKDRA